MYTESFYEYCRTELAKLFIKCITFGDFQLASGKKSHYYINSKAVTLSARGLEFVAHCVLHKIPRPINAIGGMAIGAIPIAAAVSAFSGDIDSFLVRKESKGHGIERLVEGTLKKGYKVIVVEDVTTTGMSAMQAVKAVREIGCEVKAIISLVNRNEGANELFEGIPFYYIFDVKELLEWNG